MVPRRRDSDNDSRQDIRSQFSEGFFGEFRPKQLRTVQLTLFEWNYLMHGRLEMKQRKQLANAVQTISSA